MEAMEAFQKRVIEEKDSLDAKREALRRFVGSEAFWELPLSERTRLGEQTVAMGNYSDVLGERIQAFPSKEQITEVTEVEDRLKEALTVLRDIVVIMRNEPAVQGPKYKDLGVLANRILLKHGM